MATIRTYRGRKGTTHRAVVRIHADGRLQHQESKTFSRYALAAAWAKRRELELEHPGALERAKAGSTSLGSLIRWYIDEFEHIAKWQRTKKEHLRFLERHEIAQVDAVGLTAQTLIDHVRQRRQQTAGPATAMNDLVWIGVVLRAAKSVKGTPVNPSVVQEARTACREFRLVSKGKRRDRRPTEDELARLRKFFDQRPRSAVPMSDIMDFAVASTRREAEICRLEWADNDSKEHTGLVRDAKHPREKIGNNLRFKYTPEGWKIIQRQPKKDARIFPYDAKSVGAAFTRACAILGIEDLHFHDLRHHAVSLLFERGYQIHEVALFSLHSSWNELKRYTNLQPGDVRVLKSSSRSTPRDRKGG